MRARRGFVSKGEMRSIEAIGAISLANAAPLGTPGGFPSRRAGDHAGYSSFNIPSRRSAASMNSSTISATTARVGFTTFICPTTWPTK